jgi:hypothetical protein
VSLSESIPNEGRSRLREIERQRDRVEYRNKDRAGYVERTPGDRDRMSIDEGDLW